MDKSVTICNNINTYFYFISFFKALAMFIKIMTNLHTVITYLKQLHIFYVLLYCY